MRPGDQELLTLLIRSERFFSLLIKHNGIRFGRVSTEIPRCIWPWTCPFSRPQDGNVASLHLHRREDGRTLSYVQNVGVKTDQSASDRSITDRQCHFSTSAAAAALRSPPSRLFSVVLSGFLTSAHSSCQQTPPPLSAPRALL